MQRGLKGPVYMSVVDADHDRIAPLWSVDASGNAKIIAKAEFVRVHEEWRGGKTMFISVVSRQSEMLRARASAERARRDDLLMGKAKSLQGHSRKLQRDGRQPRGRRAKHPDGLADLPAFWRSAVSVRDQAWRRWPHLLDHHPRFDWTAFDHLIRHRRGFGNIAAGARKEK